MHRYPWRGFLNTNWNKQTCFKWLWNLLEIQTPQVSSLLLFSIHSLFLWLYSGSCNAYCNLTVRAFYEQRDLIISSLSSPCFYLGKTSLFRAVLKLLNRGWLKPCSLWHGILAGLRRVLPALSTARPCLQTCCSPCARAVAVVLAGSKVCHTHR